MRNGKTRQTRDNSITIREATANDLNVYRWALERGQLRLPDDLPIIATLLQLDESVCRAAIDRLMMSHLLVPSTIDSTELHAANPELADASLTAGLMAEIRVRRHDMHQLQSMLKAFAVVYAENGTSLAGGVPHQRLVTPVAVRDALNVACRRSHNEIMAVQPGGPSGNRRVCLTLPRDLRTLRPGVRIRMLCQHAARYDQHIRACMERVVARGSQVRTRDQLPGPLIVFDRQVAFLPAAGNEFDVMMIQEPSTVSFAGTIFDMMWEDAQEYLGSKQQDHEISAKLQHAIIRLLLQGVKDEVIARRLGVSVRTCRRHISSIMDQLGATSRFQAGAMIQQLTDSQNDAGGLGVER